MINLKLTVEQLDIIITALYSMPYGKVASVIGTITQQFQAYQAAKNEADLTIVPEDLPKGE